MKLSIPELSLVVLMGASGSGKSSFARRYFRPTEIVSSDACRGMVSDDENNQAASNDAFDLLHFLARKRLARGLLTVIDATNVRSEDRETLVDIAREYHFLPVAIVLDMPERVCQDRNASRPDRAFGPHVVRQQASALRRGLRGLRREGFRHVFTLSSPEEADAATVERTPLWNNKKHETGPFDIIGDIHGCFDELTALLERLGYRIDRDPARAEGDWPVTPPDAGTGARKAVFLGDLVDRGPKSPAVLRLVMGMVEAGTALCVPGNHDIKLMRTLGGAATQLTHGLAETMAQLGAEPPEFSRKVGGFIDSLVSHYVLDGGGLVVAHAGLKEEMHGRGSGRVREFCLFGETTGETDEFGLPVRWNWAAEYRGRAAVVYGHTPVPEPEWLNGTVNIDTGCVFGGRLTALRYPEREFVSVPAAATYAVPRKPFLPDGSGAPALSAQQQDDDILDLEDVIGKRIISTRLQHAITVRAENAAAALEVMSRFAADPRWLIYLPPTMSPCETSDAPGLLEHPAEALSYYRHRGIARVICEEKHMGSRAVAIACRDSAAAQRRFGITEGEPGIVYTRTGRRFFEDAAVESALLERIRSAAAAAGLWDEFKTDWLCLDCELMPWSAKARSLIREQYAPVGAAARASLGAAGDALSAAAARYPDLAPLLERTRSRATMADLYAAAYRRYCWPVGSIEDFKLAPFHLLATEGKAHTDLPHDRHMEVLARLAAADPGVLLATPFRVVDLADPESESGAVRWWEELTGRGGEGMVVKPIDFIARGPKGLVQPAIKCRGPEYLRIIYGPEYTAPEHLARLRARGLNHKRSMALREFALGVEGLERFVRGEPLRRTHECVFGVLALESEPVDPRL